MSAYERHKLIAKLFGAVYVKGDLLLFAREITYYIMKYLRQRTGDYAVGMLVVIERLRKNRFYKHFHVLVGENPPFGVHVQKHNFFNFLQKLYGKEPKKKGSTDIYLVEYNAEEKTITVELYKKGE